MPGPSNAAASLAAVPPDRAAARLAAFRLVEATQIDDVGQLVATALAEAEARGWADVARVLLYAEVVRGFVAADPALGDHIEKLRQRADSDRDDVLLAVALASRSELHHSSDSGSRRQAADLDLAHASALLDLGGGGALERATAYIACGSSYSVRELWELEEAMYAQAVLLLGDCELPLLDAVVLFNRAEAYVRICCGLREVDEDEELARIAAAAAAAIAAAAAGPVPAAWRVEARVSGYLMSALIGAPSPESSADLNAVIAHEMAVRPEQVCAMVWLAEALRAAAAGEWSLVARHAEESLELLCDDEPTPVLALALRLAGQAEAELGSVGATKALRYGTYSARRRWEARLRTLGSARASLQTEQLRVERDLHAREALVDELTGVTNRRGYARHLEALAGYLGHHRVAVLLIDVDQFKSVNDTHGHPVGDLVLIQVAQALTRVTRPADLVARVGGDEFVIVFDDLDAAAGERRALDIQDRLSRVLWQELATGLRIGVSIGVAAGLAAADPGLLIRQADAALYAAKAQGGSAVTVAEQPNAIAAIA